MEPELETGAQLGADGDTSDSGDSSDDGDGDIAEAEEGLLENLHIDPAALADKIKKAESKLSPKAREKLQKKGEAAEREAEEEAEREEKEAEYNATLRARCACDSEDVYKVDTGKYLVGSGDVDNRQFKCSFGRSSNNVAAIRETRWVPQDCRLVWVVLTGDAKRHVSLVVPTQQIHKPQPCVP